MLGERNEEDTWDGRVTDTHRVCESQPSWLSYVLKAGQNALFILGMHVSVCLGVTGGHG